MQDFMSYLDDEDEVQMTEGGNNFVIDEENVGLGNQFFDINEELIDDEIIDNTKPKPSVKPKTIGKPKSKTTKKKRDRNYELMLNKLENYVKRNDIDIENTLRAHDTNHDEVIDLDAFKKWSAEISSPLSGLEQKSLYNKMKKELGAEPTINDIITKLDIKDTPEDSKPSRPEPKPKPKPAVKKPEPKPKPSPNKAKKTTDEDPFQEIEDIIKNTDKKKKDDKKKKEQEDSKKKQLDAKKKKEQEDKKKKEADSKKKKDTEDKKNKETEAKKKQDEAKKKQDEIKKKQEQDKKKKLELEAKKKREKDQADQKRIQQEAKKKREQEEAKRRKELEAKKKREQESNKNKNTSDKNKKPINFHPDAKNYDESIDDLDDISINKNNRDKNINRRSGYDLYDIDDERDDLSPSPKPKIRDSSDTDYKLKLLKDSLQDKDSMIKSLQSEINQLNNTISKMPKVQDDKLVNDEISKLTKENKNLSLRLAENDKKYRQDKRKMEEVIKDSIVQPQSGDFMLLQKKIGMIFNIYSNWELSIYLTSLFYRNA